MSEQMAAFYSRLLAVHQWRIDHGGSPTAGISTWVSVAVLKEMAQLLAANAPTSGADQ